MIDVVPRALGSVDDTVLIDERELLEPVELFHSKLVCLEIFDRSKVVLIKKPYRDINITDVVVKCCGNNLLTPAGKFIKVQQTDAPDGFFAVCTGASSGQVCSYDEYGGNY